MFTFVWMYTNISDAVLLCIYIFNWLSWMEFVTLLSVFSFLIDLMNNHLQVGMNVRKLNKFLDLVPPHLVLEMWCRQIAATS